MKNPRIITGQGPLIVPKTMPVGGDDCVKLLESAKNGDMSWLVVIAGGPSDYGMAMAGSNAAQMNLGIDVAKQEILGRVKAR
jgi:hypothetical protein